MPCTAQYCCLHGRALSTSASVSCSGTVEACPDLMRLDAYRNIQPAHRHRQDGFMGSSAETIPLHRRRARATEGSSRTTGR